MVDICTYACSVQMMHDAHVSTSSCDSDVEGWRQVAIYIYICICIYQLHACT